MKTHQYVIFSQLQINSYLFELQVKSTEYVSRNTQIIIEEELKIWETGFEDHGTLNCSDQSERGVSTNERRGSWALVDPHLNYCRLNY